MNESRGKTADHATLRRALDLFDELAEFEAYAREAQLRTLDRDEPALAAEVRALFDAEPTQSAPRLEPLIDLQAEVLERDELTTGERLGPYRVLSLLGRGGMGAVYLAERADGRFDGQVAIKVVSGHGRALHERFRRERRLLARLDHPSIARVLDAGVSERGMPYLVMECVRGTSLARWASDANVSAHAILRLFASLCHGVQHAHQLLIVHRDLKPGNVLVEDPPSDASVKAVRPRILDFGIAKLVTGAENDAASGDTLTQLERAPLTPAYASPEQILGEPVGTEADVYALGVMLFEALTGRLPFADLPAALTDRLHALASRRAPSWREAARTAGRLDRLRAFDTDLDRVLQRAMHPDPVRRYTTAAEFGNDLEALLHGRPVTARPDHFMYRARRFVGRHRTPVAIAGLALASLLVGFGVAIDQRRDALDAQRDADRAAAIAEATNEFLAGLLEAGDPSWYVEREFKGPETTIRNVVLEASERLDAEGPDEPLARARIHQVLGNTLRAHGEMDSDEATSARARHHFREAVRLRRTALGNEHPLVIESLYFLGTTLPTVEERLDVFGQALDLEFARSSPTSNGPYLAVDAASAMVRAGRIDEARVTLRRAAPWLRRLPHTHALRMHTLTLEERIALAEGDLVEADRLLQQYGQLAREAGDQTAVRYFLQRTGTWARWQHDWPRLEQLANEELDILGLDQPPAPRLSETPLLFIDLLLARGQFEDAARWFPEGALPDFGSGALRGALDLLGRTGPVDAARCQLTARRPLDLLGDQTLEAADLLRALADCLERAGDEEGAERTRNQARKLFVRALGPEDARKAMSWTLGEGSATP